MTRITLPENVGKPIEGIPDTDKERLFLIIESEHVETICSDVMCSGAEG